MIQNRTTTLQIFAVIACIHLVLFLLLQGMPILNFAGRSATLVNRMSTYWIRDVPIPKTEPPAPAPVVERRYTIPTTLATEVLPAPPPASKSSSVSIKSTSGILASPVATTSTKSENDVAHGITGLPLPLLTLSIPEKSQNVVFLIDASGSMLAPLQGSTRFAHARRIVRDTIEHLPARSVFNVIYFADRPLALSTEPLPINETTKQNAFRFLESDPALEGETGFLEALQEGFRRQPDLLYILTDGDDSDPAWEVTHAVKQYRQIYGTQIQLHAINFAEKEQSDESNLLSKLCRMTGGESQWIKR